MIKNQDKEDIHKEDLDNISHLLDEACNNVIKDMVTKKETEVQSFMFISSIVKPQTVKIRR